MYTSMSHQPARLGSFEPSRNFGEFGQTSSGVGYITAVSGAINGIIGAIVTSKTTMASIKSTTKITLAQILANVEMLKTKTEGQVESERIHVQEVSETYKGLTKLIGIAGVALAGLMMAGAFSYSVASKAQGEYEYKPIF